MGSNLSDEEKYIDHRNKVNERARIRRNTIRDEASEALSDFREIFNELIPEQLSDKIIKSPDGNMLSNKAKADFSEPCGVKVYVEILKDFSVSVKRLKKCITFIPDDSDDGYKVKGSISPTKLYDMVVSVNQQIDNHGLSFRVDTKGGSPLINLGLDRDSWGKTESISKAQAFQSLDISDPTKFNMD